VLCCIPSSVMAIGIGDWPTRHEGIRGAWVHTGGEISAFGVLVPLGVSFTEPLTLPELFTFSPSLSFLIRPFVRCS